MASPPPPPPPHKPFGASTATDHRDAACRATPGRAHTTGPRSKPSALTRRDPRRGAGQGEEDLPMAPQKSMKTLGPSRSAGHRRPEFGGGVMWEVGRKATFAFPCLGATPAITLAGPNYGSSPKAYTMTGESMYMWSMGPGRIDIGPNRPNIARRWSKFEIGWYCSKPRENWPDRAKRRNVVLDPGRNCAPGNASVAGSRLTSLP